MRCQAAWGTKTGHHVAEHVNNKDDRSVIETIDDAHAIAVCPAWCRDRHLEIGDRAGVVLGPGARRDVVLSLGYSFCLRCGGCAERRRQT